MNTEQLLPPGYELMPPGTVPKQWDLFLTLHDGWHFSDGTWTSCGNVRVARRIEQPSDKFAEYKNYVHGVLDAWGVPNSPDQECRVGTRLKWLKENLLDQASLEWIPMPPAEGGRTADQCRTLIGRELDRAVEEICFADYPSRSIGARAFSTDANLIPLAFAEGGPLEPDGDAEWEIVVWRDIRKTKHFSVRENEAKRFIATGPDMPHAVWRAACVVMLEKKR